MVKNHKLIIVIISLVVNFEAFTQDCLNAHSHNDYKRERPLYQAYENNFRSVEADIFLRGGRLLVAHSNEETDTSKTLESMYLEPLEKIIDNAKPVCYPLILLIDIKEDGKAVYDVLTKMLQKYQDILTGYYKGEVRVKIVSVIISGDRPFSEIADDSLRLVAIDGRLSDIDKPSYLYPLISEDWFTVSNYLAEKYSSLSPAAGLKELCKRIKDTGKLFRIWGAPDNEKSWELQLNAGVTLINTDNIAGLRKFLLKEH